MVEKIKCSSCGELKPATGYYTSKADIYKAYERLPMCKQCLVDIYNNYTNKYEDVRTAIYYTCRKLNICFHLASYNSAIQEIQKGKSTSLCQIYMTKLNSIGKKNGAGDDFDSSDTIFEFSNISSEGDGVDNFTVTKEILYRWGNSWSKDELQWLEIDYHDWTTRHEANTLSLERLFQMICIKELEIRNARLQNNSTDKLEKSLRELLNDSNLTPKNMSAIHESENAKTFGLWLKDIEQNRPAEYFQDKKIYHDYDGIGEYFERFVLRPMKNLLTGTRDFDKEFNVETVDGEDNG